MSQAGHPSFLASSNFFGLTSTPTMCVHPTALHACTTAKPTAPRPKTATDEPYSTLQLFQTAPRPVEMPQPKRHACVGWERGDGAQERRRGRGPR